MMKTIDIRLNLDEELSILLDAEVKRLRTSGRAGYFTQMLAAIQLARQGDMSLIGMFTPRELLTQNPPQLQAEQTSETESEVFDFDNMGGLF